MSDIPARVAELRGAFDVGVTKPYAWRIEQLRRLRALLQENGTEIEAALARDLGKNRTESYLAEIGPVVTEINLIIGKLRRWLRPRPVSVPLLVAPARAAVVREPLGVVLVIAPWNYPIALLLEPLAGAIAAGNAVVAKPSELAPATSSLLAALIPRYLDPRAVAVVEGGADRTTELLGERFDHIFYTGSGRVARTVMRAAAEHLTPVTLELGGKSPAYVDDTVDLAATARRLAWGKFLNAGQTCVAPDYVLTTPALASRLAGLIEDAVVSFWGADPSTSGSYGRIVDDAHFARLVGLLGDGTIAFGGRTDASSRYISPTVLTGVGVDAEIMREEVFGPILPIVTIRDLDAAIEFITAREKPLVLYAFTESKGARRRFRRDTSSGALAFGAPLAHMAVAGLPFGGVGASGIGSYHGERTVSVFSHEKAVFQKALVPETLGFLYPPFTPKKDRLVRGLARLAR